MMPNITRCGTVFLATAQGGNVYLLMVHYNNNTWRGKARDGKDRIEWKRQRSLFATRSLYDRTASKQALVRRSETESSEDT